MDSKHGKSVETALVAAAIVAALYFGREVLLPIALAILLSFVLAPLARLFKHLYLPRIPAVLLSVVLAFTVISAIGTLMFSQVSQLAGELPHYQWTLSEKIKASCAMPVRSCNCASIGVWLRRTRMRRLSTALSR